MPLPVYTHIKTLQDNHRYKVSVINFEGQTRILKQCNDSELQSKLHHDIQSNFYLEMARSYNIESVFRVRKIITYGHDWYIAEKLDGDVLFDASMSQRSIEDNKRFARELYAPFIFETSVYTPQVLLHKHPYRHHDLRPNNNHNETISRLKNHACRAVGGSFISRDDADLIIAFVTEHLSSVEYGIELYDLDPWEMFILSNYTLGIIDLEYMNLRGRRHFDMAYNYLRLYFDLKQPIIAAETLRKYDELCGDEKYQNAFLSLFGLKLMGYLSDASRWMDDTEKLGKPVVYSHDEADLIVNTYLEFSIKALIDI